MEFPLLSSSLFPPLPYAPTPHRRQFTSMYSPHGIPFWDSLCRNVSLVFFGGISKFLLHNFNDVKVYGNTSYYQQWRSGKERPMVTVSNHDSIYDDPVVLALTVPFYAFFVPSVGRFGYCAKEICFPNEKARAFMESASIIPVSRGRGLFQSSITVAEKLIKDNRWFHIFPEGKVIIHNDYRVHRCRWGVSKIIMAKLRNAVTKCKNLKEELPLIVPIVHQGMKDIVPYGKKMPRMGKKVRILIGEPIEIENLVLKFQKQLQKSKGKHSAFRPKIEWLYEEIGLKIQKRLGELQAELNVIVENEETN